jgi:hypothetical protein
VTTPSAVNNANVSTTSSSTLEDTYEEEDDETDDNEQKQENVAPSFTQLANQQTGFSFAKSVSEVQNDDDNYEPDIQVKPLVSLPELETIVTGEENESVLFENHAKLFHNVNGEWKERGKGIMKILRNDETKRCRCVMKREQVLKLCCNHYIVEGMKLKPFQNSKVAWLWKALKDCSSDNVMDEVLVAVRFKTADIALNFKDVFEKCCHRGGLEEDKRETSDTENNKRMEIKDIKADDDDQMKEDDEIKAADDDRMNDEIKAADDYPMKENGIQECDDIIEEINLSQINLDELFSSRAILCSTLHDEPRQDRECVIKVISHKEDGDYINMTSEDGDLLCSHAVDSIISLSKSLIVEDEDKRDRTIEWMSIVNDGDKGTKLYTVVFPTAEDVLSFQAAVGFRTIFSLRRQDADEVIFVSEELPPEKFIQKAESLLLPKSFYNYVVKPSCSGCIGCNDDGFEFPDHYDMPRSRRDLVVSPSPLEEEEPFTLDVTSSTVDNDDPPDNDEHPNKDDPPSLDEPPALFSGSSMAITSFADLAGQASDDFKFDRSFKFAGTGKQLFASNTADEDEEREELDPEKESCGISFKPVVILPESYQYHSIEEESHQEIFSERAKLYRFDKGEWKEKGIGVMKMLYFPETGRTRLLMRRDQILKLCCNHYISSDMTIEDHMGNPKTLTWLCKVDYSDENPRPEKFVIKFKLEETAKKFKECFEKAVTDSTDNHNY